MNGGSVSMAQRDMKRPAPEITCCEALLAVCPLRSFSNQSVKNPLRGAPVETWVAPNSPKSRRKQLAWLLNVSGFSRSTSHAKRTA